MPTQADVNAALRAHGYVVVTRLAAKDAARQGHTFVLWRQGERRVLVETLYAEAWDVRREIACTCWQPVAIVDTP